MTLTNQALSSAADKDLELSKQVCREAVNEVIEKNHLTLSPQFTQNLVVHLAIAMLRIKTNNYIPLVKDKSHHIKQILTMIQQLKFVIFLVKNLILNFQNQS